VPGHSEFFRGRSDREGNLRPGKGGNNLKPTLVKSSFFFFGSSGFELRISRLLGRRSTAWALPKPNTRVLGRVLAPCKTFLLQEKHRHDGARL
jgi:hypothetical protein